MRGHRRRRHFATIRADARAWLYNQRRKATATLLLAIPLGCTNAPAPTNADTWAGPPTAPAIDRAPQAASLKDDARHGPVAAAIERLIELHPDAHDARLDIDRVFGGGYGERTFNYKQHAFRLMAGNADIESGYTIIVSDLKLTAQDEATLTIGVVYVSATNRLTDDLYDVRLALGADGVWTVTGMTSSGHFDGVLVEEGG